MGAKASTCGSLGPGEGMDKGPRPPHSYQSSTGGPMDTHTQRWFVPGIVVRTGDSMPGVTSTVPGTQLVLSKCNYCYKAHAHTLHSECCLKKPHGKYLLGLSHSLNPSPGPSEPRRHRHQIDHNPSSPAPGLTPRGGESSLYHGVGVEAFLISRKSWKQRESVRASGSSRGTRK